MLAFNFSSDQCSNLIGSLYKGDGMCYWSEQPFVGREFGTDPNNDCEEEYLSFHIQIGFDLTRPRYSVNTSL